MRFNEGDVVRISKDSTYFGRSNDNPRNVNGIITRINELTGLIMPITVEWVGGEVNVYREIDLKLVRRKNEISNWRHC